MPRIDSTAQIDAKAELASDVEIGAYSIIGKDLERERPGVVRQGRIGRAEARLFRQRPAVDYAVLWLQRNRTAS